MQNLIDIAFLRNPFFQQVNSFLCVFFLGGAFSCLLRILLPSRQKLGKSKPFSSFCVFLTFSVVFYTALIFAVHSLFWFSSFSKIYPHYYVTLGLIFLLGLVIFFFWKVAFPIFLVFYFFLSIFTNSILKVKFGEQRERISIIIEENSPRTLLIDSYRLSETLLLPIKRNWFVVNKNFPEVNKKIFSNSLVDFYLQKILPKNSSESQSFVVPEANVFPTLYSAKISFENGKLKCEFSRDL